MEVPLEERYKVLIRQVGTQLKTFGASPAAEAAAQTENVPISKLLSLASKEEKYWIYIGWVCSIITGAVLPVFIFLLGPIFDSFAPDQDSEESLRRVGLIVGIMCGLGLVVWIASYISFYFQQRGAMAAVRRIKKAYFNAVL